MTAALDPPTRRPTLYERTRQWERMSKDERLREYVVTRDKDLCVRLLQEHDGIARTVARRYSAASSPEDIYQVARIGLLNALRRYDPDRGSFVSFAFRTVRGDVQRHLRDTAWPVSAGRSAREGYLVVRDEAELLTQRLRRQPTCEEIAEAVGASPEEVAQWQAVAVATATSGLNESDGEAPQPVCPAAASALADAETRLTVAALLAVLPERQRTMLGLRYLYEMSQREIAATVGVSQMNVSRSLKSSVERIRRHAQAVA